MRAILSVWIIVFLWPIFGFAQTLDVSIVYLEKVVAPPPTLSNLDPEPVDLARAGAELGLSDISTTGKFLGNEYSLEVVLVEEDQDFQVVSKRVLSQAPLVLINAPSEDILAVSNLPEAKSALIFNVATSDITLREEYCRANVFHTIPSRSMLSDALAQFAVKKRWGDWAMIVGPRPEDERLSHAITTSAKKFGLKISGTKNWTFDADLRRSAAQEVPLFTQDFDDHDMLIVADEANDFARYVQFNTWLPRPIAGSWGIVPTAWSASVEQHGAAQLQSRFVEQAGRSMRAEDYAAMLAMASIGEAVTRTKSNDPQTLRRYLLSADFEVGGFKGRPLSFRDWNGQMRQPIPLAHPGAVVALAPLEGFLHQFNELDTLGNDKPTSNCTAFTE